MVDLTSSKPAVVTVSPQAGVLPGATSAIFDVIPHPVTAPTRVTITATTAGESVSTTLTVIPPPPPFALDTISASPATVAGTGTSTVTIRTTSPAPAGGAVVKLTVSDSKLVSVPATVTVPAGPPA